VIRHLPRFWLSVLQCCSSHPLLLYQLHYAFSVYLCNLTSELLVFRYVRVASFAAVIALSPVSFFAKFPIPFEAVRVVAESKSALHHVELNILAIELP